jgi:hypothetical protein
MRNASTKQCYYTDAEQALLYVHCLPCLTYVLFSKSSDPHYNKTFLCFYPSGDCFMLLRVKLRRHTAANFSVSVALIALWIWVSIVIFRYSSCNFFFILMLLSPLPFKDVFWKTPCQTLISSTFQKLLPCL